MGLFKTYSEKEVKRVRPIVEKINSLEPAMKELSDSELVAKTPYFKEQLKNGKTLDDILPEAFAVVREASRRVLGMRHFDVQLIGGIILHQGRIAEMKTGEGKTLVATLPVYLNALTGEGVHVITVNDYLAKRDSEWMGNLYRFLGLSVGLVIAGMNPKQKQEAYACDVTYGTNNEFGFDYLRDTPLIISGRGAQSSNLYQKADHFVKKLQAKVIIEEDDKDYEQEEDNEKYDYIVDLKAKSATLTQQGIKKAEQEFGLENFNDLENSELVHDVNQALHANGIMKKDKDYIVKDGQVLIVDEFTGRIMYGRRYNDGLHQAIEAKEHVKINDESKTLATITFQNYFRMYEKLSGMTGTAMTEEAEFQEIYKLDVVEIPTNKPMIRKDNSDIIYKNEDAKFRAVIADIKKAHEKGQPVLIGTVSIDKSEKLSKLLDKEGIPHEVLNAKYHEKEAQIIAQAGKFGAVTIATNMAGRGTDIMLGGNSEYLAKQEMRKLKYTDEEIEDAAAHNETDDKAILAAREKFNELEKKFDNEIKEEKEKVIEAGGLKIIGTQRHESRRIDNQLRGRSGRQGDPGESRFYIGLDDDLMKIFGGDIVTKVYNTLGADEDMPIESRLISKAVENAQKKVEGRNFSIRKNVLQYDDVMNVQRTVIYEQRRDVLDGMNLKESILKMMDSVVELIVDSHIVDGEEVNKESIAQDIETNLGISDVAALKAEKFDRNALVDELIAKVHEIYASKETEFGEENLRELERVVMLKIVDQKWMDHIDNMDELKKGIGLRGYGQQDPVVQYRLEGTEMFDDMIEDIRMDVVKILLNIRKKEGPIERTETTKVTGASLEDTAINLVDGNISEKEGGMNKTVVNEGPKVGRNDPCPCGSGKKYKNCCGKNS